MSCNSQLSLDCSSWSLIYQEKKEGNFRATSCSHYNARSTPICAFSGGKLTLLKVSLSIHHLSLIAKVTLTFACAASQEAKQSVPVTVVKNINNVNEDGSYTFEYETSDGAFKTESKDVEGNVKGEIQEFAMSFLLNILLNHRQVRLHRHRRQSEGGGVHQQQPNRLHHH